MKFFRNTHTHQTHAYLNYPRFDISRKYIRTKDTYNLGQPELTEFRLHGFTKNPHDFVTKTHNSNHLHQ